MVILKNISRRMITLNLAGLHMREDASHGYKPVRVGVVDHLADGTLLPRFSTKFVPEAITLPAGEQHAPLPNSVLGCEDVKGAIARHELRVLAQSADEDQNDETEEPSEHDDAEGAR